ncbi:MAG: radical SAM protein [candidate division WWE3 bacterium]|nr:radical SAM protein [candidate division WWE3 bacterium]
MYCFIVKATTDCNIGCGYCYQRDFGQSAELLSVSDAKRLITQAAEVSFPRVNLIWHGEEPLLLGLDFYRDVFSFGQTISSKVHQVVQTNATLLDKDWAQLFAEYGISVGVSLDGPKSIHNRQRTGKEGQETFEQVLEGMQLLKEHNVPFGTLSVVTPAGLDQASEIYHFLVETGLTSFDFLGSSKEVTLRQFAEFMFEVFLIWTKEDNPNIHIRQLENVVMALLGGQPSLCRFNGSCADYLTVLSNGDVYPCDNLLGFPEFRFGNIHESHLNEILASSQRQGFLATVAAQRERCKTCQYWRYCFGGCTAERLLNGDKEFCGARRFLIGKIRQQLQGLL